jgi:ferritin
LVIGILLAHYAAIDFLNWYVKEQTEEESSFNTIIGQVKLVGDRGPGMFQLDREAGTRVFTPPTNA